MSESQQPIVLIQRSLTFSAGHRLFNTKLSDEENLKYFGPCNQNSGHGHNFKVKVTLKGPIDPVTGFLFNFANLKNIMEEAIMSVLDHKNIVTDVEYFKDQVCTCENIAVFIWKNMKSHVGSLLYEIKIKETDKNGCIYRGEGL